MRTARQEIGDAVVEELRKAKTRGSRAIFVLRLESVCWAERSQWTDFALSMIRQRVEDEIAELSPAETKDINLAAFREGIERELLQIARNIGVIA